MCFRRKDPKCQSMLFNDKNVANNSSERTFLTQKQQSIISSMFPRLQARVKGDHLPCMKVQDKEMSHPST